jgi:uncharacterized Zn-finger protein
MQNHQYTNNFEYLNYFSPSTYCNTYYQNYNPQTPCLTNDYHLATHYNQNYSYNTNNNTSYSFNDSGYSYQSTTSPKSTDQSDLNSTTTVQQDTDSTNKKRKYILDEPMQTISGKRPRVLKLTNLKPVALGGEFKCLQCVIIFNSAAQLLMHQHQVHNGGSSLQCPICERMFNSRGNLMSHLRTHTQEKLYKCEWCEKAFCDQSTLIKHKRTHTNEKPYECTVCKKRFSQTANLKRHMGIHQKKTNEITVNASANQATFLRNQSEVNFSFRHKQNIDFFSPNQNYY